MISYDALRAILTMSITGSILAIILFALKPFVRDRLPKSTQYYLWLVVLLALVVPISKLVVMPASVSNVTTISETVDWYVVSNDDIFERIRPYETENADGFIGIPKSSMAEVETLVPDTWVPETVDWFRFVHYLGVVIYLAFICCSYAAFTGRIKRRNTGATTEEHAMLDGLCGKRHTPHLYRNPLAATPMLIGIFRPAIILPDREYTTEQLHAVLLHELTHLRRKDVIVKWLSVVITALHWFNPIVWLVRREIDRACELACDEAVISNLDANGKQNYGETLLYVAADTKTHHAVLSTTMCEEKKALKERLGAIMKNKKHSRLAIIVSAVLIIAVGGTAIALGAGRAASRSNYNFDTFVVSGYKLYGYMDDEAMSILTPAEPLNSKSGYAYNFEEIRFDLNDDKCMTRFQVNVYDIGIFDMWVQYSDNHPDKREGNNGLAFLGDGDDILRRIAQVEALIGEGKKGWYDREQRLRYERYTADNGDGEVTFVYTDGEDNGILNRLVWVIAEGAIIMEPIAENETRPVLTLYGFDQSKDNGDAGDIKKHFTERLQPEADTGWTIFTDMIFIDVQIPDGTVAVQTYYAEAGTEATAHIMFDGKYSNPQESSLTEPRGNTWRAEDYFPNGFLGHIWAVTIDADGAEHYSDIINVIYEPKETPLLYDDVSQRVEDGLLIIMSSPLTSSNPQDYINEHWQEYENLTAKYPEGVLEYLLSQFESDNTDGLRGQIMMRMCKDMLGLQNNVTDESLTPQEWYNQLSIISEIKLPDFKPENPEDEYEELAYSAIAQYYSRTDDGFLVSAPTVYGAYEEEGRLKIIMTVFYERYRLYGKTLESTSGGVIPGAAIFTKNESNGEWVFEEYLEVGSANLPDGMYFNNSIQKLCVMPVSGQEIAGLAEKMNKDYANDTRRELLSQNLIKHLSAQGHAGVSLKKPGGEMIPLT